MNTTHRDKDGSFSPKNAVARVAMVLYPVAMNRCKYLLLVSFLALPVLRIQAAPPVANSSSSVAKKAGRPATAVPESALKPGMTADDVKGILGKPDAVKPMKAPEGKAEVWIYRRVVDERFSREQAGSVPIVVSVPDSDGTLRQYTVGENARFVDVKLVTEDIVEVLMFNGRYVTQKTTRREYKRLG